jgi:hypothetical protein
MALRNTDDGILAVDPSGRVTVTNPGDDGVALPGGDRGFGDLTGFGEEGGVRREGPGSPSAVACASAIVTHFSNPLKKI